MRGRHRGAPRFAALFALLLYTFLPSLHAILHDAALLPAASVGAADEAPSAPSAPSKPVHPGQEQGCALGQGLAGHGPALQPLAGEALLAAAPAASLVLPPQHHPRSVSSLRPSSRGPPALEA